MILQSAVDVQRSFGLSKLSLVDFLFIFFCANVHFHVATRIYLF